MGVHPPPISVGPGFVTSPSTFTCLLFLFLYDAPRHPALRSPGYRRPLDAHVLDLAHPPHRQSLSPSFSLHLARACAQADPAPSLISFSQQVLKAVAITTTVLDVTFYSLFGATAILIYTFIVPRGLDGQGRLDLSIFPDDPPRALRTPGSSRILKRPTSHSSISKPKKVSSRSAMNKSFFSSTSARHHHQLVPRRAPPPPPPSASSSSRLYNTPTRLPPILSHLGHRDPNHITPSPPHARGAQHRVHFTAVPVRTVALRGGRAGGRRYGSIGRAAHGKEVSATDDGAEETALSRARRGVEESWFPSSSSAATLVPDGTDEASGSEAGQMMGVGQEEGVMTPPSSPEIMMDLALAGAGDGGEEGGVVVGGSAARRRRQAKGKGRAQAVFQGGEEENGERHGLGLSEMGLE